MPTCTERNKTATETSGAETFCWRVFVCDKENKGRIFKGKQAKGSVDREKFVK